MRNAIDFSAWRGVATKLLGLVLVSGTLGFALSRLRDRLVFWRG